MRLQLHPYRYTLRVQACITTGSSSASCIACDMQLGSLIGITSLIQLRDNTSCLLGRRLMRAVEQSAHAKQGIAVSDAARNSR